jgi:thiamine-monophosphate kinase
MKTLRAPLGRGGRRRVPLSEIGEDEAVRRIEQRFGRRHPRLIKAIGDDASVAVQKAGNALLCTTDILIEGTHFKPAFATPYLLGKKALGISLSDIAAMGGTPIYYLVSIALPSDTGLSFLDGLYRGLSAVARRCSAALAGGNTARSPGKGGKGMVSTTVIGEAPEGEVVLRSGARPGDTVYVTGHLGDSALGRRVLEGLARARGADEATGRGLFYGWTSARARSRAGGGALIKAALKGRFRRPVLRHLAPEARLEAGRELASRKIATAMIDVSDGFVLDLKRLCGSSGVGAVVEFARIPLSAAFRRFAADARRGEWASLALAGGEDYELIFTAPAIRQGEIASLGKRLGLHITPVGRVVPLREQRGVAVLDERMRPLRIKTPGFEHF